MGRRRSGRRRAAGSGTPDDSPADSSPSSSSGGSAEQKSSSSGGSTVHQATPLSQQTGGEVETSPPPPQDSPALRRKLLGLIRGFYLDAISRLPTADLRATLARGLLVGGHCYGPLHPLYNIIANSVWYAAAFPLRPADCTEVHVLDTQAIDRAVRRSLDGLVACLLHICPFLSPADALWQLSRSRADLRVAVASARSASVQCAKPSILHAAEPEVVNAAFQLAAEAARHPNPAAFAFFACSVLPAVERDVSCLLVSKRLLTSLDIDRLSSVLLPHPLPDELSQSPPHPSPMISQAVSDWRRGIAKWHKCLLEIADVALCKFTRQTGLHYELHTIYGDGLVEDEDYCEHFHINFMGQPKGDLASSSGAVPGRRLFFFAEAPRPPRQDFREEDISMCCLVGPSQGDIDNCHACLMNHFSIDHPPVEPVDHTHVLGFGGQCYRTGTSNHNWDFRPDLGVDYLFFDSDRDSGLVEYLHNHFARIHAYSSKVHNGENVRRKVENYCKQLL